MNIEKARKIIASENGKKSVEARKKKFGNMSKLMSNVRNKKKIIPLKDVEKSI